MTTMIFKVQSMRATITYSIAWVLVFLLLILPISIFPVPYYLLWFRDHYASIIALPALILLISSLDFLIKNISVVDLFVILFIFLGLARGLILIGFNDEIALHRFVCWFCMYFLVRLSGILEKSSFIILFNIDWVLIGVGFICAIIALLQGVRLLPSFHPRLRITGPFFHSVLLSNYLVIALPIATRKLLYLINKNETLIKALYISFMIVCMLSALYFCYSRTAYLSLALVGCTLFPLKKFVNSKWLSKLWPTKWSFIGIGIVIMGLIFIAYKWRPESVIGRMLVWKQVLIHCVNHPIVGHGIGSFRYLYPDLQREDFTKEAMSDLMIKQSGETYVSFNDFIQLFFEGGFLLPVLFILMIFLAWRCSSQELPSRIARSSLLGSLPFLLFSYSLHTIEISTILFLLLAISNRGAPCIIFKFHILGYKIISIVLVCMFVSTLIWFFKTTDYAYTERFKAYLSWGRAFQQSSLTVKATALERLYPLLSENEYYLFDLSNLYYQSERYEDAIRILCSIHQLGYNGLMLLAKAYKKNENITSSKFVYLQAHQYVPSKLEPLRNLLELSIEENNKVESLLYANKIIALGRLDLIKKSEIATESMAKKYLYENFKN